MVVPSVIIIGDSAIATRWVGYAKKIARLLFKSKIASRVIAVDTNVTLHVNNTFPTKGPFGGVSKVIIDAEGGMPVMVWSFGLFGGFSVLTRMMIQIFNKVKEPYTPIEGRPLYEVAEGFGVPTYGEPYNPYSMENWKWVKEVERPTTSQLFVRESVLANSSTFRILTYYTGSNPSSYIDDEYLHYKVRRGDDLNPIEYLYSTPYWDAYFTYGLGWYLFAMNDGYLYEMCTLQGVAAPVNTWFSVRKLSTGEMLLYKTPILNATNMFGLAARGNHLVTLTGDLSTTTEYFLLDHYTISKAEGVVSAVRDWRVDSILWDTRGYNVYGNAIAINNQCVYWLYQVDGEYFWVESRSLKTGAVVGSFRLDPFWTETTDLFGDPLIVDPYFGPYEDWTGVAADDKYVYIISNIANFDMYKRIPEYNSGGDIISETYEKVYYLKAVKPQPGLGDYERNAIITY